MSEEMTKKYIYFVSYFESSEGSFTFGSAEMILKRPVEYFGQIEGIAKSIKGTQKNDVAIINYQLLRIDENE
jgi:hypothetical protein